MNTFFLLIFVICLHSLDFVNILGSYHYSQVFFSIEEDTHLVGSWLNVSMDPIVDDGQSREHFWLRVIRNYNNFYGNLRERTLNQVISWWQKINVGVQKFKDHYKQVVDLKKNGYKKSDVMIHAYVIWKEDEGNNFALKHAWWLLKDQPYGLSATWQWSFFVYQTE